MDISVNVPQGKFLAMPDNITAKAFVSGFGGGNFRNRASSEYVELKDPRKRSASPREMINTLRQ